MGRFDIWRIACLVAGLSLLLTGGAPIGLAQEAAQRPPDARRGPVYQRRAFEWSSAPGRRGELDRRLRQPPVAAHQPVVAQQPVVRANWFQRPYPYHLDYYRMRYGGSYAPYFGNLYGPPQVVTAPPYYGPYYDPYFTGVGYGGAGAYGAPPYAGPRQPQPPSDAPSADQTE